LTNLSKFLKACAKSERLVGKLYSELAARFPGHVKAAALFQQLAEEEEHHARTFEFLQTVGTRGDQAQAVAPDFFDNLARLEQGIERALRSLSGHPHDNQLLEAIRTAIRVESTTLERDKTSLVWVADREFRNLLTGLAAGDESHRRQLEALQESLSDEGQRAGA